MNIGHTWHVLNSDTPDDVAAEVSAWFNSGNNSSPVTHEIEHIRCLQRVCVKEVAMSHNVVLASVVAKTIDAFIVWLTENIFFEITGPYSSEID